MGNCRLIEGMGSALHAIENRNDNIRKPKPYPDISH
jgi:hypothetical protein